MTDGLFHCPECFQKTWTIRNLLYLYGSDPANRNSDGIKKSGKKKYNKIADSLFLY